MTLLSSRHLEVLLKRQKCKRTERMIMKRLLLPIVGTLLIAGTLTGAAVAFGGDDDDLRTSDHRASQDQKGDTPIGSVLDGRQRSNEDRASDDGEGAIGAPVYETETAPAPIESVDIIIAESFPPQYFANVSFGLPSGCAQSGGYEVTREGTTIHIVVSILVPTKGSDVVCTMIYGFSEYSIALGSSFEPDETYAVVLNDEHRTEFIAQ